MMMFILLLIIILCCDFKDVVFLIVITLVIKNIMKDKRNAKLYEYNHKCDYHNSYNDMNQNMINHDMINHDMINQNMINHKNNKVQLNHTDSHTDIQNDSQNDSQNNESVQNNPDESEYQKSEADNKQQEISTEMLTDLLGKLETSSFAKVNNNDADYFMCNRMSYSAMQAKQAINNRAKYHKHSLTPYFDSELRANEERDWWDRETDYLDVYM